MTTGPYADESRDSDIARLVSAVLQKYTSPDGARFAVRRCVGPAFCLVIDPRHGGLAYWEWVEEVERGTLQWDVTPDFITLRMKGKGR